MNPFAVPYPKASQSLFLKVSLGIALSIIFTLVVFQPFGTASFEHPYKLWILCGYGIVSFIANTFYFYISKLLLSDKVVDRWSIMNEFFFILGCLFAALVACFFYWALVFNVGFSFSIFWGFIKIAFSVAIVPVSVYLIFLYLAYKDVRYAQEIADENPIEKHEILLRSANESEVIRTTYEDLLCIKSNDNYVIVYSLVDGQSSRYMIRNTMKHIESQLESHGLVKCHRSYLVNTSKIQSIDGNVTNSKLTLEGLSTPIPVSRSKVASLREIIVSR